MDYSNINTYQNNDFTNVDNVKYKDDKEFKNDIMNTEYEYITIDTDDIYDSINETELYYPVIPDPDLWESFLNRSLKDNERQIIHNYLLEKDTNLQIKALHYNLLANGYFHIPNLTNNNGNCLWESLSYLGYGRASEIRKNIAALLLLIKNDMNFYSNGGMCAGELFLECNDVELVIDCNSNQIYEYDYEMMVIDLYTNNSWTRLPMELILMTISRIYEVQIKIFSNKSEYVNTITTLDYDEIIYLGHINEEHYIPVIELDADIAVEQLLMEEYMKSYPIYVSAKHKYHKWGNFCVNELNFYVQDNETIIATKKDNPIKNNDIKGIMSTINLDLSNDIKETENFNDFHVVI
jgi:hypothetical protein